MAGHAKKCVERYCELANKTTQQLYKVSTPCIDDHHFKEEEMKSVGELSQVCSQIVLKCLYLARIGRPDILWSVNKSARSITKWTKACDKRLNRLISYIHHTCEYGTVINLQSTKVYVFSDSVLCLGRVLQHPESNEAWKNRVAGIQSEISYRDYDGINGESTEFEWNIFAGFTTLQLCDKIIDLLSDLGQTPETFTGRILFMSMFNDISCDKKGNKDECLANAGVVKVLARRFGIGQWSFIAPGSEKKWYSGEENSPQGAWDHIAESKGHGKLSIHFTVDYPTIETIFRIIISANQLSLYGAVANMCEEFETHQDRSGEPDVLMGQSIVLSEIKAEVPLQNENPSHHQILWQQYEERIWSVSQDNSQSWVGISNGTNKYVSIQITTTQKFLQIYLKNKRHNRV